MRYWAGFTTGVAAITWLAFAYYAARIAPAFAGGFAEFDESFVPSTARLAVSPLWSVAILFGSLAIFVALNLVSFHAEKRRALGLGIATFFFLALLVFTGCAAYSPFFDLSGNISG